jgi:hypothetical protein
MKPVVSLPKLIKVQCKSTRPSCIPIQVTPGHAGSAVVLCVLYSELSENEQNHKLRVANDLSVLEIEGE